MASKPRPNLPGNASGRVPFISDWHDLTPFSDVPANAGVTDARHMLEGWTVTRQKALRETQLEAEVGDWNTVPAGLLDLLAKYRRAVARIVVPGGQVDHQNIRQDGGWTGTGFLVAPNLLLTNHHVLNSAAVAGTAIAEFDYEWPSDKLFANVVTTEPPTVRFELAPARLFLTSPVTDGGLDYSFVWISEKASEQFGMIRMERGSFMINQYEPTFVIHHPRGRLKEVSLDDTELLAVNSLNILYAADTDRGSSGACVFNRNGRLVALHHAFQGGEALQANYPEVARQMADGRPVTIGNEGIKISAIALDLESRMRRGDRDAQNAAAILEHIEGSDTLTGIFGALGRQGTTEQHAERVREVYGLSGQDIDLGFWNLFWLLGSEGQAAKVEAVVTAMADLNQDAWALTDASPPIVAQIVKGLCDRFGEDFEVLYSDKDARTRQLATAVVWRRGTVLCSTGEWPGDITAAWTRPLPELTSRGPVFDLAPGLFHIASPDDPQARLHLVPLSLRTLRDDELRRRLASRLLARAAEAAVSGGQSGDWIFAGDSEPPVQQGDFERMQAGGHEPATASAEGKGVAFSYLRAPRSRIRNVFVTADMTLSRNPSGFFEVVRDRTVEKFVQKLAESRPTVLRLTLGVEGERASTRQLDAILDGALGGARGGAAATTLQSATRPAATERQAAAVRPWHEGLAWRGLDKTGFLAANRAPFGRLLDEVARQQRQHFPDLSPLTELDLWVITHAEAGLGANGIDPSFRHSNGEIGLFPLPGNIAFWIGPDAPAWNRPMPIETNVMSYALYLGQIRNKPVVSRGGRTLYRDLFREPAIAASQERQTRLLAGIVHGYFVGANYRGRPVPFERILQGFADDEPVDRILRGTGYVHAGSSILVNRQRNIDAGVAAFRMAEAAGPRPSA